MLVLFRIGFLEFSLVDLADIVIVSILFIAMYRALRNTVAVQILLGLLLLLVVSVATESMNLKAFNWILRTITDVWLIAFIILFQPEIRRVLLIVTRTRLFRLFIRQSIADTIDEVITATKELSERHTGALVVFTRTQNVKMTIDTGIPLQAKVSEELLISIFNPKSPLHDGAVVIENQILIAARCVLPLSTTTKYEGRNLGTRHRAALGISEQTDAVILVVSEETGQISLAQEGKLTVGVPFMQLKEKLSQMLNEQQISAAAAV